MKKYGDKIDLISKCLDEDINMSTRNIIRKISKEYNVIVSKRHVQRIRKKYKKNVKSKEISYFTTELEEKENNGYIKRKLMKWEEFLDKFEPIADEWKVYDNYLIHILYNNMEWYINREVVNLFGKEIEVKKLNQKNYTYRNKDLYYFHESWFEPLENKEERKDENKMSDLLTSQQINLINIANEGGWTVQSLAVEMCMPIEGVKLTLKQFKNLVKSDVLDEENDNVYFATEQEKTEQNDNNSFLEDFMNNYTRQQNNDYWEVEIDCVDSCSKVEKTVTVLMSRLARTKSIMYMKWAGAREWLAYLIGNFDNELNAYCVTDLFLPDQRTTSVLVDKVNTDGYNDLKIIGVIHSHHEMGAGNENNPSFSSHDEAFINSNHNISLLAGKDKESGGFKIVGIGRVKTPCGSLMKVKAVVKNMKEILPEDEQKLKDEFFAKTQNRKSVEFFGNNKKNNFKIIDRRNEKKSTYHFNGGGYPGNQFYHGRGNCR